MRNPDLKKYEPYLIYEHKFQLIFYMVSFKFAVLNAGEDTIALTWGLNQSYAADTVDDSYREFKVKLCFAPISQLDRGWRKTLDDLSKDKTCQFTIFEGAYQRNQSFKWRIETDVPTAVYFVRAYAFNSAGEEVAYGQTTDAKKRDRLFEIKAISGRHLSLDIASGCLSAFSLVSLVGFYMLEKNRTKSYVLQRTNI